MIKLLVIADDFTGALDTGVQFKARDSMVMVCKHGAQDLKEISRENIQVLIVDTETRHLDREEAYRIVFDIIGTAVEMGISYIYKKTDSGMRGNIGSELTAMLRASQAPCLHFIPAFPQMGRTTVNGIQYIDGVPVAESVFGADPFEPVRNSSVKAIIGEQSDVQVREMGNRISSGGRDGILVYDSATEEELYSLALSLKKEDQLHFLAGCAGLASILFGLLGLEEQKKKPPKFDQGLVTLCGSLNSVTVRQLDFASAAGMGRIRLSPEQKLSEGWADSREGRACILGWKERIEEQGDMIIECGVHDLESTSDYAKGQGIKLEEARKRIADAMGGVMKGLLDCGMKGTFLVTGGDTLLASMQHIRQNKLVPVCELVPGVVLSRFEYRGAAYNLLSKSGGFGQENLLLGLAELIKL